MKRAQFIRSARKAVATFVFATGGVLIGNSLFAIDAATWKLAAGTGLGALINLAYRWSEAALSEPAVEVTDGSQNPPQVTDLTPPN